MKEYNPQVLRKVQLAEMKILQDFDAVCQKHGISYVLFYGAGIGVLRHKGFIPWDDDLDVLLLRKDYEKFLQIVKTEIDTGYYLLTADEDSNYPFIAAQWGPENTTFITPELKEVPCKFTIFLDIHPLDSISDDVSKRKKQCFAAWFWQKLMLLRQISKPVIQYCGLKRTAFYFACGTVHIGMKILHISPKWLYRQCKKVCLRYEGAKTKDVSFLTGTYPGENIFSKDELFPPRYLEFEGVKLPFPNKIETLLARHYGDYMQLPPEEDRRNHFPSVLDFGDGERYENDG